MAELGAISDPVHRHVGAIAVRLGIDAVIAVGPASLGIAEGAVAAGMSPMEVVGVASIEDAIDTVTRRVRGADVIPCPWTRALPSPGPGGRV